MPSYDSSLMAMEMYRVHSMEDIKSLPKTRWNIQQPSGITTHTISIFVSWKRNGSLTVFYLSADEGREDALSSGGLDLIVSPGLGFTKVYYAITNLSLHIFVELYSTLV